MLLLIVLQHRRPHSKRGSRFPAKPPLLQIHCLPDLYLPPNTVNAMWARPSNSVFGNRRGFCSLRQRMRPISDATVNLVSWGSTHSPAMLSMGLYLWEDACHFLFQPILWDFHRDRHWNSCFSISWFSCKWLRGYAGLPCHANAPNPISWPAEAAHHHQLTKLVIMYDEVTEEVVLWKRSSALINLGTLLKSDFQRYVGRS